MQKAMQRLLALILLLSGCSEPISRPVIDFNVQTPRPFGYVIGDEISQRILIEVRHGLVLRRSSLPVKGRVNRWLDLNDVRVEKRAGKSGVRFQVDLRYQIFHAPLEVKMLSLPGLTIQFRQGVLTTDQKVPPWHFTVAPIRELAIRKDEGIEYMRPDAPTPLIDATAAGYRLFAGLLLAIAAGVYLAYRYGLLPGFPRQRIFRRAMHQLKRIPDERAEAILRTVHQALNALNKAPLFEHKLEDFYRHYPRYRHIQSELEWFFKVSNRCFFATDEPCTRREIEKVRRLCRLCLELERSVR